MKRTASNSLSEAKRIKLTPYIPRLTRVPTQDLGDLCNSKIPDETKCVAGRVKMWWPATEVSQNKARAIVEFGEGPNIKKIQLKLGSKNEEHLKSLTIRLGDRFRLSLRGAKLETLNQIPKLCTHPYCLQIMNGFNIEWVHSNSDGTEDSFSVNCWADEGAEQDINQEESKAGVTLADGWYTEDEDESALKEPTAVQISKQKASPSVVELHKAKQDQTSLSSRRATSSGPPPGSTQKEETHSKFEAGCRTRMANYPAIASAELGSKACLIGIVVEASEPSLSRTGEWMRFLNIIDPSNYDPEYVAYGRIGFKVNLFAKKHKEWLPHPRIGDAVVLRNVKIQQYQDHITGTVMASGLMWAAYSPDTGKVHHGPPNSAPKEDRLTDTNHGALIKPYYSPGPAEVTYCVKLSDWWREVRPKDFAVTEHQPSKPAELPTFGVQRVHRLIQDVNPSVEPNGYFDCTVEILRTFSGHNPQIHTLYVTDYTDNNGLHPIGQDWCPQELSQAVLQLDAWDAAADAARDIQVGQYYSIKNVRIKVSQSNYLEAKVVQNKMSHLKGEMADRNPHLRSLLERKRKRMTTVHPSTEIQHKLIADIEEGSPFNCTVELLHISEDSENVCLFVTDYTDLTKLVGLDVREPWAEGLQGKVMKLYLTGQQANAGRALVAGAFYRINKLVLSNNPVYRCYCCALTGSEKLIHGLSPTNMSNEFLNGVLRRKSRWEAMVKQGPIPKDPKHDNSSRPKKSSNTRVASPLPPPPSPPPPPLTPLSPKPSVSYTRIKDISFEDDKPARYRVYAQVSDFHPTQLREAFYQMCAQCRKEIPRNRQACFDCADMDRQYVQFHYQVYIKVEDEDGTTILISINDQSSFLKGLARGDISHDMECLTGLVNRLRSIMDHLLDSTGRKVESRQQGSFHLFELDSWVVPDGKRAFCLRRLIETV